MLGWYKYFEQTAVTQHNRIKKKINTISKFLYGGAGEIDHVLWVDEVFLNLIALWYTKSWITLYYKRNELQTDKRISSYLTKGNSGDPIDFWESLAYSVQG